MSGKERMSKLLAIMQYWRAATVFISIARVSPVQGWSSQNGNNDNFKRIHLRQQLIIQPWISTFNSKASTCRSSNNSSWDQKKSLRDSKIKATSTTPLYMSHNDDGNDEGEGGTMNRFPEPVLWLWSPQDHEQDQEDEWKAISEISRLPAAARTWNWSRHFVLKLNLCPWAKGSLENPNAMQIFCVNKKQDISYTHGGYADHICHTVAQKCLRYCEEHPEMESSIIFFVVFQEEEEDPADFDCDYEGGFAAQDRVSVFHNMYDQWENFVDFHEWFTNLEDDWDMDEIIVAPFHPNWQFGGGGQTFLDFEKKSPYLTITFVSAKVVEQAGEAATSSIADKNEETLQGRTIDDLGETWKDSTSSSPFWEN